MKVLELGGGTGILSFFAARQGATVWCVERNPELVRTARQLLEENRVTDRVHVVEADAFEYLPPEPVDVVICEMLHVAMLREKQLEVIDSFKSRYQATFGDRLPQFIPDSSLLAVQPIEHKFSFAGYRAPIPLFQDPGAHQDQTRALAELTPYASIFYEQSFSRSFEWTGEFRIDQSGKVTALRFVMQNLVGFENPQKPVLWANQFLVLPISPLAVDAGQRLSVSIDYASGEPLSALADSISAHVQTDAVDRRRAA
jgi:SAM-dependent methyltransferase